MKPMFSIPGITAASLEKIVSLPRLLKWFTKKEVALETKGRRWPSHINNPFL